MEALGRDLGDVERLLEELAQRRNSSVADAPDPAEEQEELRRQREEEKRRLLEERQAARDPRRNLAMRLDVARESGTAPKAPMKPVEFISLKGHDMVPLVDVRLLQGKCMQLGNGASVASLLELQRVKEKFSHLGGPGKPPGSASSGVTRLPSVPSTPGLGSTRLHSSRSAPALGSQGRSRTQERVLEARTRKQAKTFDQTLQRLFTMRSQAPESALHRLEALADKTSIQEAFAAAAAEDEEPFDFNSTSLTLRPSDAMPSSKADALQSRVAALVSDDQRRPFAQGSARNFFLATCMAQEGFSLSTTIAQQVSSQTTSLVSADCLMTKMLNKPTSESNLSGTLTTKGKKKTRMEIILEKKAAMHKVRVRLRQLRGVVKTLLVYFDFKRRQRSVVVIGCFLRALRESDQIKYSCRQLNRKITLLTKAGKAYVDEKRSHAAAMERIWQDVEDKHLMAFYEVNAKEIAEECGFTGLTPAAMATNPAVQYFLDWRRMRVPERERTAVLRRYYHAQLAKRIAAERNLAQIILQAAREQRELNRMIADSGDSDAGLRSPSVASSPRASSPHSGQDLLVRVTSAAPFWHWDEETVLDLVAVSASALGSVEPFRRHPALLPPSSSLSSEARSERERLFSAEALALSAAIRARFFHAELDKKTAKCLLMPRTEDGRAEEGGKRQSALGGMGTGKARPSSRDRDRARASAARAWCRTATRTDADIEDILKSFTPRLCISGAASAAAAAVAGAKAAAEAPRGRIKGGAAATAAGRLPAGG